MSPLHRSSHANSYVDELNVNPLYANAGSFAGVPRHRMPDNPMPADTALAVIRDELILDGNARQNLATFCTTWMEPQAGQLIADCLAKNMIDKDEYPQTAELERRCVNILAHLWHAADPEATGCSTTGSSEAVMLGGMALKWRWRERRGAAGLATDRPNLVMGTNVHVCWQKFCRYWDVEPRMVPMTFEHMSLDGPRVAAMCDENTIGVIAVLGSTEDGRYDPVAEIAAELDRLAATTGVDVPLHIDAASGGFVAPFLQPALVWDFQIPRVQSINVSGHKYGLVYPGVGWIIWRDAEALPEDLVFRVNVLGGDMATFALNFSRPGAQVAAQYYNFLRLGFEGYRRLQQACQDVAMYLSGEIGKIEEFELLSDGSDLPVFGFTLRDDITNFTVFDLSDRLRQNGWQVPAYTLPADLEDVAIMRIVVRPGLSMDLASMLLADIRRHVEHLAASPQPAIPPAHHRAHAFHH
ncbi:MAG TPA: glutamate decarboxylase [Pseudonocardiaceae bacterium]|nr:glutamate decarboxylase [Pseudonocardiaceae bacterium]